MTPMKMTTTTTIATATAAALLMMGCAAHHPTQTTAVARSAPHASEQSAPAAEQAAPVAAADWQATAPSPVPPGEDTNNSDSVFKGTGDQTRAAMAVQADAGAADDSTLYPRDFDGPRLNSLGEAKLAAIARGRSGSADAVAVYLDMPDAVATADRRQAVGTALENFGVPAEKVRLAVGANPAQSHLVSLTDSTVYEVKPGTVGYTAPAAGDSSGGGGGGTSMSNMTTPTSH